MPSLCVLGGLRMRGERSRAGGGGFTHYLIFVRPSYNLLLAITYRLSYTISMPTSHFHYVYIQWDGATHTRFYVGHTADLAARLKTHNAGHVPHTS